MTDRVGANSKAILDYCSSKSTVQVHLSSESIIVGVISQVIQELPGRVRQFSVVSNNKLSWCWIEDVDSVVIDQNSPALLLHPDTPLSPRRAQVARDYVSLREALLSENRGRPSPVVVRYQDGSTGSHRVHRLEEDAVSREDRSLVLGYRVWLRDPLGDPSSTAVVSSSRILSVEAADSTEDSPPIPTNPTGLVSGGVRTWSYFRSPPRPEEVRGLLRLLEELFLCGAPVSVRVRPVLGPDILGWLVKPEDDSLLALSCTSLGVRTHTEGVVRIWLSQIITIEADAVQMPQESDSCGWWVAALRGDSLGQIREKIRSLEPDLRAAIIEGVLNEHGLGRESK